MQQSISCLSEHLPPAGVKWRALLIFRKYVFRMPLTWGISDSSMVSLSGQKSGIINVMCISKIIKGVRECLLWDAFAFMSCIIHSLLENAIVFLKFFVFLNRFFKSLLFSAVFQCSRCDFNPVQERSQKNVWKMTKKLTVQISGHIIKYQRAKAFVHKI